MFLRYPQKRVPLQLPVRFLRRRVKNDRHILVHKLRQREIVLRFHADTDVTDRRIDRLLRTVAWRIGEDRRLIALVRHKERIPVRADRPPKPRAAIQ